MSIPAWFGLGVGACAALWWWRFCVRMAMWTWEESTPPKPSLPAGLIGGSLAFIFSPIWGPIYCLVKAGEAVEFRRVLTERVFPEPKK